MREDIKVWLTFLSEYNGVTVITDNAWASNETLELFTDSAGGQNREFGNQKRFRIVRVTI